MKNSHRVATNSARMMPLAVSMISAGKASEVLADYHLIDVCELITGGREGFMAFEVTGDSMIPDIKPGYIVFIDSWAEVQNGNVIAAEMNGLTCIKIFKKGTNGLFLVSANRNYQAKEVTSRDDFRVLGIVRAHLAIHR